MLLSKRKNAFTLIELMVVCAIIAVLATVVVMNYKNAKMKVRDARRIADLNSINTSLKLFYNTNEKIITSACGNTTFTVLDANLNHFLVPDYLSAMPKDPLYPSSGVYYKQYLYLTTNAGYSAVGAGTCGDYTDANAFKATATRYFLYANMETDKDINMSTADDTIAGPFKALNHYGGGLDWTGLNVYYIEGPK